MDGAGDWLTLNGTGSFFVCGIVGKGPQSKLGLGADPDIDGLTLGYFLALKDDACFLFPFSRRRGLYSCEGVSPSMVGFHVCMAGEGEDNPKLV